MINVIMSGFCSLNGLQGQCVSIGSFPKTRLFCPATVDGSLAWRGAALERA